MNCMICGAGSTQAVQAPMSTRLCPSCNRTAMIFIRRMEGSVARATFDARRAGTLLDRHTYPNDSAGRRA